MAPTGEPVDHRHFRDAGNVHGGVGHFHRLGGAAAHRRQLERDAGRGDLGSDELPGLQRHYPAGQHLVFQVLRPKTVSVELHCDFHHVVLHVWRGHKSGISNPGAGDPGGGRRRAATAGAVDPDGKFSALEARGRRRGLWRGRDLRPDHRPDFRRLADGQLFVALGVFTSIFPSAYWR